MTNKPEQGPSILLMRHAKSSWSDGDLSDHDRPLNARGREAAPIMGRRVRDERLLPDVIYTSTALRARETTKSFVEASGFDGQVIVVPRLYLAEPKVYLDLFTEVPLGTRRAMFVGHNPGIADLVLNLTGREQEMCTAGIAHISLDVLEIAAVDASTAGKLSAFFRPPRE